MGTIPRILVIEDDPELPSILRVALGDAATLTSARSWTDARAHLRQTRFDLILLDLFLPDANLLEPLRAIRELDPDYPVILMSGNIDPDSDVIDRAMRLGVTAILNKPFSLDRLEQELRTHLRQPQ